MTLIPDVDTDLAAERPRKAVLVLTRDQQRRIVDDMIATAIAEGRHSTGPVKDVCSGCRQLKVCYHETGVSGGSGIAGRTKYCLTCGQARDLHVVPRVSDGSRCACGAAAVVNCPRRGKQCEECFTRTVT